ncbi:N-acetylmuramoyl-L-alanine amidase [Pedobacter metabolipauper]|uniref:N-acetylmuramoyl-L-alanine amidase n=2 Tax=Pedobacter metabolipauper TaxID=425513 RepID=A0A4V3D1Q6_9SPHI|nr:N-acetylmuramoyl-L-alanine amidase [Pedobacter metabolipauper]
MLSSYQAFTQEYKIKTIVIDAGHGGKDGSTRGLYSTEKDVALKTALNLGAAIEANMKDVKVIYTRTEDVFIPLYERIGIANNAKADLFISIHCNDMPVYRSTVITGYKKNSKGKKVPIRSTVSRKSTNTRGVETFVSGMGRVNEQDEAIKRENASIFLEENYKENYEGFDQSNPEDAIILGLMKNTFRTQSLKLARLVQDQYVNAGRINRGVQEKSLAVLARAGMPAILTEIGFISNPDEEDYMNSEAGQKEIVDCLLKAIENYKKNVEG